MLTVRRRFSAASCNPVGFPERLQTSDLCFEFRNGKYFFALVITVAPVEVRTVTVALCRTVPAMISNDDVTHERHLAGTSKAGMQGVGEIRA